MDAPSIQKPRLGDCQQKMREFRTCFFCVVPKKQRIDLNMRDIQRDIVKKLKPYTATIADNMYDNSVFGPSYRDDAFCMVLNELIEEELGRNVTKDDILNRPYYRSTRASFYQQHLNYWNGNQKDYSDEFVVVAHAFRSVFETYANMTAPEERVLCHTEKPERFTYVPLSNEATTQTKELMENFIAKYSLAKPIQRLAL